MDNYIVINGKKTELTKEQLKALGIEVKKKRNNPFDRVDTGEPYYSIHAYTLVNEEIDEKGSFDDLQFYYNNYFNDRTFTQQVVWHQLLYRKLLKYSWDNEAEDNLEWNWDNTGADEINYHYFIYKTNDGFKVGTAIISKGFNVYFSKYDVAHRAIADVVKPFMEEHPEFEW